MNEMLSIFGLLLAASVVQGPDSVSVLLRGGTVYDGSGAPGRIADVGLLGDRIVLVGVGSRVRAGRVIEARGLIVAPGFIDPHTHVLAGAPSANESERRAESALMQGITTVTIGPDGRGPFNMAQVMSDWDRLGAGTNVYNLVGFGAVRGAVMGSSSAKATPAQIDSMRKLIDKAMREGAYGGGGGLFYAPQSYSSTEEVIDRK